MARTRARVPTGNAGKYIQQLCKHWSHKLEVETADGRGIVRFERAVATMMAEPDALVATIEADDPETLAQMKDVLARHLDRFAFREAPLAFDWRDSA